ncbi:MAG: cell division protein ZapA [Rhodothermales bacterium]
MEKTIRVQVMGRDYPLRIAESDEALTREMAAYVDAKMKAFKQAFPKQPEVTTAVVTALALAEELFSARDAHTRLLTEADREVAQLDALLEEVMGASANGAAPSVEGGR